MDTINKSEAIEAMLEGKKVRHRYFSDNEWMTMVDPCTILLEDGVKCHPLDFWADRTGPAWETDWTIVSNKSEKEQKSVTLQECKDEVARKYGVHNGKGYSYAYWQEMAVYLIENDLIHALETRLEEAAELHASLLRQENQRLREALNDQVQWMYTNVPSANSTTYPLWVARRGQLETALQNTKEKSKQV